MKNDEKPNKKLGKRKNDGLENLQTPAKGLKTGFEIVHFTLYTFTSSTWGYEPQCLFQLQGIDLHNHAGILGCFGTPFTISFAKKRTSSCLRGLLRENYLSACLDSMNYTSTSNS
ncbi:unnamed protein product, partial [Heterosigma akashiwo]